MNSILQKAREIIARWLGPGREARRLDRDAATIIETVRATASSSKVRATALRVRDDLETAHARGGEDPSRYGPVIAHFRTQHREARRRHDDTALTALTLIIIYLRAEMLGGGAAPARTRIDDFVSEWRRV